jgi:hypothetical protein
VALAASLMAIGCDRKPRPWQGRPDGGVVDESQPFLPTDPDASALGTGDGAGEPSPHAVPGGNAHERPKNRAGGLWVSCAAGLRATGEPKKDASRLASVCGPANGMRRIGSGMEGNAREAPSRHPLPVRASTCYRVFGVADLGVTDLDVVVQSVRGTRLAADDVEDRVVMVERDRPFCSFGDEELTIEVRAKSGAGRYALEIYQLPANP